MIAVVHEVRLAAAQKDALVRLLRWSRGEGPTAIVARLLWCEGETVHLIALWESSDALDCYLATAEVRRGSGDARDGRPAGAADRRGRGVRLA